MRVPESHGRLGIWQVGIIIAVPTLAALAGGIWLAYQAMDSRVQRTEGSMSRELLPLARIAAESVRDEIRQLGARARLQGQIPTQAQLEDSSMVLWAELRVTPAETRVLRKAVRPGHAEAFDSEYLEEAVRRISTAQVAQDGVGMLRLRKDPVRRGEWLLLAYSSDASANAPEAISSDRLLIAIVDPATAFPIVRNWSHWSDGGRTRAWLVAGDGTVLAHSQPSYAGADFSDLAVFKAAVREMIENRRGSGSGTFSAIDSTSVQAAYEKAGALPIGVTVERESPPSPVSMPTGIEIRELASRFSGMALALTGALGALVWLAALGAASLASRGNRPLRRKERNSVPDLLNEISGSPAPKHASIATIAHAAADPSILVIQEMPVPEQAFGQNFTHGVGAAPVSPSQPQMMSSQLVEAALSEELATPPDRARRERERRIALARFEMEIQDLAEGGRDGSAVLKKLTTFAADLAGSPVVFFKYFPETATAILHSYGGFGPGESPGAASIAVTDELPPKIAKAAREGRILALADYLPLATIILRKFQATNFRAWAVTGGPGHPDSLLGFLVVLHAGERLIDNSDSLARVIRAAQNHATHANHALTART